MEKLSKQYKVLDLGYIKLTGTLISESDDKDCAQTLDQMVVESARVSYGAGLKGEEKDKKLLHYLIEHEHGTPFESAVFKFEVKCPIFVQRQWRTHRWGSFNEISGRYTENISNEFYIPEMFRSQDTTNKQGSIEFNLSQEQIGDCSLADYYMHCCNFEKLVYNNLIKKGVAKELARGVLGTAFYTKFVWVVNARSLMNFLILRCDSHAQWEIRQYANAILDIFKEKMPWTYEKFMEYFAPVDQLVESTDLKSV